MQSALLPTKPKSGVATLCSCPKDGRHNAGAQKEGLDGRLSESESDSISEFVHAHSSARMKVNEVPAGIPVVRPWRDVHCLVGIDGGGHYLKSMIQNHA